MVFCTYWMVFMLRHASRPNRTPLPPSPAAFLLECRTEKRAAEIEVMKKELEAAREASKKREAEKRVAAEKHREALRARAPDYKERKDGSKVSAFAR